MTGIEALFLEEKKASAEKHQLPAANIEVSPGASPGVTSVTVTAWHLGRSVFWGGGEFFYFCSSDSCPGRKCSISEAMHALDAA